jgi:hypothetical protein
MSTYTNQTFQLHTTRMEQADAQAQCNRQGGHLASFSMLEEQNEVETAYKTMVSSAAQAKRQYSDPVSDRCNTGMPHASPLAAAALQHCYSARQCH